MNTIVEIREAVESDFAFVVELMNKALTPYYDGDHAAHAERIFRTHASGGKDRMGFFSHEQKMFVAVVEGRQAGIVHVVGKRQSTYKISPLIVADEFQARLGVGSRLLGICRELCQDQRGTPDLLHGSCPEQSGLGIPLE